MTIFTPASASASASVVPSPSATSPRLVLADLIPGARVRDMALVLAGAGLTGIAAQISIHTGLSPVPFTLQTLAVLAIGATLGFIAAAGLVGALAERGQDRNPVSTVGTLVLGSAVVYVIGTWWLAADLHVGLAKAIELGVTPFLVTDALKIAFAAIVLPTTWRLIRR